MKEEDHKPIDIAIAIVAVIIGFVWVCKQMVA